MLTSSGAFVLFTSLFEKRSCSMLGVSVNKSLLRISFSEFSPATRRFQMAAKTSVSTLISRMTSPSFFSCNAISSLRHLKEVFTSCKEVLYTFDRNPFAGRGLIPARNQYPRGFEPALAPGAGGVETPPNRSGAGSNLHRRQHVHLLSRHARPTCRASRAASACARRPGLPGRSPAMTGKAGG